MFFSRHVQIGQHHATMTLDDHGYFRCSWSPSAPRDLSAEGLAQYMAARDRLVNEMRDALVKNRAVAVPYLRPEWTDKP